jgi:ribosome biogenesis GTPase
LKQSANGLVVAGRRRHFLVELDDGARANCVIKGRKLEPTCGDRVRVTGQRGDGVIEAIAERASLFWRTDAFREKVIAANVDQVIGVVAVAPAFSEELVNRWIVATEANGCRFVLVLNKIDLPHADEVLAQLAVYVRLGYEVVALSAKRDVSALRVLLAERRSVLVGQSGMGKSTLVNALVPDAAARVGEISAALGTGKHTTTHSQLYRLDAGSWLVDSPGLQEFGLHHLTPGQIEEGFVEFRALRGQCKFRDCRHDSEPGCALHQAVAAGRIDAKRAAYLRRFKEEIAPKGYA